MKKLQNYSLLKHNTFGIDIRTDYFVDFDTEDEIRDFLLSGWDRSLPLLAIGGGSNLLFLSDFRGIVLHVNIQGIEVLSQTDEWVEVRVGAGVVWDDFVAYAVAHGWYGAENLSLIPGEVGASAVQNIGAYGVEAKDLIVSVETLSLDTAEKKIFTNAECEYAYRHSIFKTSLKGKYLVTHVVFRLTKQPVWHLDYGNIRAILAQKQCELTLENLRNAIIEIREQKLPDPKVTGNAGSFFMNPVIPQEQFAALSRQYPGMPFYPAGEGYIKVPAGWLIDQCGWKGSALGCAGVHKNQALVLVNLGGASGKDIVRLAEAVVASVKEKFGIEIHPEVNFIGELES